MKVCPTCKLQYSDEESHCFIDRAALRAIADPLLGRLIAGRYLLETELGAGAFARVYRARNTLDNQLVAVKVLRASMLKNKDLRERFRREAKNTAALAHPNIIEILDYGESEEATFMVMELLDGETLTQTIKRGALPIDVAIGWAEQIAQGLARAHDFSVFHRDLKPDNIYLHRSDSLMVKILDFGVARSLHDPRLTQAGQIFGTPQYMAPEMINSKEVGGSADLYALGCILFEMLTGAPPFMATDMTALFVKHLFDEPPSPSETRPEISAELEKLTLELLAKEPADRPPDAHHVSKMLSSMLPKVHSSGLHTIMELEDNDASISLDLPFGGVLQWEDRIAIFEQMVRRAFPAGDASPSIGQALGAMRIRASRLRQLRKGTEGHQQALQTQAQEAKEGRQRLGRAMQVLGSDLSTAREAVREAERWLQLKKQQVTDLEYQVQAVSEGLDKIEAAHEKAKANAEAPLLKKFAEIADLERDLPQLASRLTEPLRDRPELEELFARLRGEGLGYNPLEGD